MTDKNNNIESFTFVVEENISPPKKLFEKESLAEITSIYSKKIYVSSFDMSDKLINFGEHTIFEGLYQAYVNHCPIVLSPDVFWTLIIQAFTRYVLANSESLREKFVDFQGKKTLKANNIEFPTLESIPIEVWKKDISFYVDSISDYVGKDLIGLLKPDFSTTTPIISQVGQINIMSCMQNYFEYKLYYGGCGYPKITLEGTIEDYLKLKEKTLGLKKYGLNHWIDDEIVPILDKIIDTKKGNVDKEFWKKMYYNVEGSINSSGTEQKVKCIKGWLLKFAPFDKHNNEREKLDELSFKDPFFEIPNDLLNAPLKTVNIFTGEKRDLVIRAGFIGMEQNEKTYEMKPVFGWYVSDYNRSYCMRKFQKYNEDYEIYLDK